MVLKLGGGVSIALTLTLCVAASASGQSYTDDYICKHGNPADGRTADACDRTGEPVPSASDRANEQADPTPGPQDAEFSLDVQHGLADRQRYEAWFQGLLGDYLAGATYWETHRSIRNAPDCITESATASTQWRAGCLAAQASLRGPDALRHSSPYYRQGWNSYQAAATSPDQSAPVTNTEPVADNQIAAAPAAAAPVVDAPANPPPPRLTQASTAL